MLAKRYLNPRRAVLSSFTLISLVGVMLGVLVLVVVMAVYAGLERDVKERLLGFTPHILVSSAGTGLEGDDLGGWQARAEAAAKIPGVIGASAYVADNVILDVGSWQRPVAFRAVDTSDPSQVAGIENLLDLEKFPESSADLGLDDRAIISSIVAAQFKLQVGDTLRLYSTRNFEEVLAAFRLTEQPVVRERFPESFSAASKILLKDWASAGEGFVKISGDELDIAFDALTEILNEQIRDPESEIISDIRETMNLAEYDKGTEIFTFTINEKTEMVAAINQLAGHDAEKLDGEILKSMKGFILPKEATVIGVYSASQMAVTPDIFVPLPLAQDLAGLEGEVQGVSLRLEDPYDAEQMVAAVRSQFAGSVVETWGDQYQAFFALISQQRVMMYFALSFIVLISAFSMMAVMFTVTIQKKREIGVMKALGAAPSQIVRVFLYQGMLLGLLGAGLGIGFGRLVIYFRGALQVVMRKVGFDPFSESLIGFDTLPAHNNIVEQLSIGLMAFVLCSIAALVPAFFAARSDAARSLRNL